MHPYETRSQCCSQWSRPDGSQHSQETSVQKGPVQGNQNATSSSTVSTTQIEDDAWVQCEKPDCLKWRRIRKHQLQQIDSAAAWYCHMHPDGALRSCSLPEEDYATVHRHYHQRGFRYVHSTLPLGSLVWAKMAGFCSWPALVTQQPGGGQWTVTDVTSEALSYHVEFLGEVHSRAWVASRFIELYGQAKRPSLNTNPGATRSRRGGGARSVVSCVSTTSRKKTRYKSYSVEHAVNEADRLLPLELPRRLASGVQFPFKVTAAPSVGSGEPSESECKVKKRRTNTCSRTPKKNKDIKKLATKTRRSSILAGEHVEAAHSGTVSADAAPSACSSCTGNRTEAQKISCMACLEERLSCSSSMVGRSKEEKFALDIEMYRKNEAAFERDVNSFMQANGQKPVVPPAWQRIKLSLFQIFIAIYEKGGYDKVTKAHGGWSGLYYELTGHKVGYGGISVKRFYTRNLLPYELHARGKDFTHSFSPSKQKKRKVSSKHHVQDAQASQPDKRSNEKTVQQSVLDDKALETSLELSQWAQAMEAQGAECPLPANLPGDQVSVDLSFYDEGPISCFQTHNIKEADTADEFGPAKSPGEAAAQLVPDGEYQDEEEGAGSQEQVLHEMQALQHQLEQLQQQLDQ